MEEAKTKKKAEIVSLETKCADLRTIMSELKTQLYAKFGNRINLESEDDWVIFFTNNTVLSFK